MQSRVHSSSELDRWRGCLSGLAIGEAEIRMARREPPAKRSCAAAAFAVAWRVAYGGDALYPRPVLGDPPFPRRPYRPIHGREPRKPEAPAAAAWMAPLLLLQMRHPSGSPIDAAIGTAWLYGAEADALPGFARTAAAILAAASGTSVEEWLAEANPIEDEEEWEARSRITRLPYEHERDLQLAGAAAAEFTSFEAGIERLAHQGATPSAGALFGALVGVRHGMAALPGIERPGYDRAEALFHLGTMLAKVCPTCERPMIGPRVRWAARGLVCARCSASALDDNGQPRPPGADVMDGTETVYIRGIECLRRYGLRGPQTWRADFLRLLRIHPEQREYGVFDEPWMHF